MRGRAQAKVRSHRTPMQGWDERMRGWARDAERIRPRVGHGKWVVRRSIVSVGQRLIELEGTARSVVGNGCRIGGVEFAGLIELEEALGRRPSGR